MNRAARFFGFAMAALVLSLALPACGGGDPEPEVDCKALRAIAPPPGKTLELPPECVQPAGQPS